MRTTHYIQELCSAVIEHGDLEIEEMVRKTATKSAAPELDFQEQPTKERLALERLDQASQELLEVIEKVVGQDSESKTASPPAEPPKYATVDTDPLAVHRAELAERFIVGLAATGKVSLTQIGDTSVGKAAIQRLEDFFKGTP